MAGHYFLHVASDSRQEPLSQSSVQSRLHAIGMLPRAVVGDAVLYTSAQADFFQLPEGGFAIGELYFRDGQWIQDAASFPALLSARMVRDYVLAQCWGDYVLIQPVDRDRRAVTVTRSPSHACDLQCIYCSDGEEGFVTSDLTLATHAGMLQRKVDFTAVTHRLLYPNLKHGATALVDVNELLPGCSLHLGPSAPTTTVTWTPWDFVSAHKRYDDIADAAQSVRQAIETTVGAQARRHKTTMLELSGGLDSSIVGACLNLSGISVSCQTLTLPVPGADERSYAAAVAAMLGVELSATEIGFDDVSPQFALPEQLAAPSVGILQFAVDGILQRAARLHGAESYFSGGGGDTVFGYLSNASPAADAFRALGLKTGLRTVRDLSDFHQCTYWKAACLTLRKLKKSNAEFVADRLLISPALHAPAPEPHPWHISPDDALPGDLQRIEELASSQLFRESCIRGLFRPFRMPLLSQPVIEACLRVPSWMWFEGGQNRAVARKAFADLLPAKVAHRKSKGTFTSYLGALYRRKKVDILEMLIEGELQAHGMLDTNAMRRLSTGDNQADEATFMRVLHLCAVENWVRQQSRSGLG